MKLILKGGLLGTPGIDLALSPESPIVKAHDNDHISAQWFALKHLSLILSWLPDDTLCSPHNNAECCQLVSYMATPTVLQPQASIHVFHYNMICSVAPVISQFK